MFYNVNFFPPVFSFFFLLRLLLVLDKITAFIGLLLIREVNQIRGAVSKEKTSLGDIPAGAVFRGEHKIELYIKISSHEACFFFSFFTASAILSFVLAKPRVAKNEQSIQTLVAVGFGARRACHLLFFAFGHPFACRSISPWLLGWKALAVLCVIDCSLRET